MHCINMIIQRKHQHEMCNLLRQSNNSGPHIGALSDIGGEGFASIDHKSRRLMRFEQFTEI